MWDRNADWGPKSGANLYPLLSLNLRPCGTMLVLEPGLGALFDFSPLR